MTNDVLNMFDPLVNTVENRNVLLSTQEISKDSAVSRSNRLSDLLEASTETVPLKKCFPVSMQSNSSNNSATMRAANKTGVFKSGEAGDLFISEKADMSISSLLDPFLNTGHSSFAAGDCCNLAPYTKDGAEENSSMNETKLLPELTLSKSCQDSDATCHVAEALTGFDVFENEQLKKKSTRKNSPHLGLLSEFCELTAMISIDEHLTKENIPPSENDDTISLENANIKDQSEHSSPTQQQECHVKHAIDGTQISSLGNSAQSYEKTMQNLLDAIYLSLEHKKNCPVIDNVDCLNSNEPTVSNVAFSGKAAGSGSTGVEGPKRAVHNKSIPCSAAVATKKIPVISHADLNCGQERFDSPDENCQFSPGSPTSSEDVPVVNKATCPEVKLNRSEIVPCLTIVTNTSNMQDQDPKPSPQQSTSSTTTRNPISNGRPNISLENRSSNSSPLLLPNAKIATNCPCLSEDLNFESDFNNFTRGCVVENAAGGQNFALRYVDTHCHLNTLLYQLRFTESYGSFKTLFSDTWSKFYHGCITCFCRPDYFLQQDDFFRTILQNEDVKATVGCHPNQADLYTEEVENWIMSRLSDPNVVGYGDFGLDFSSRNNVAHDIQQKVFKRQLKVAMAFGKPLLIHCRFAEFDSLKLLKQIVPHDYPIHLHNFTGDAVSSLRWSDYFTRLYFGVTPVICSPRNQIGVEFVQSAPLNRLLVETNAPYMLPDRYKANDFGRAGLQTSHPGIGSLAVKKIADIKCLSFDQCCDELFSNTQRLYDCFYT